MQTLVETIRDALKKKKTKEAIYLDLLKKKHTVDEIESAFYAAHKQPHDTEKRAITIVVTVGAILIGAGIFSFIASNWQEMETSIKITIILTAMIAAYAGGWYMDEKKHYTKTGYALYLLGSIIYGSGIFLVAQMMHIRANWPDGFILWMLGALAMAYALESRAIMVFAFLLAFLSLTGYPEAILVNSVWGGDPFLLTSTVLLVIATVVCFIVGRTIRKKVQHRFTKHY